jgi:hypothetical protein
MVGRVEKNLKDCGGVGNIPKLSSKTKNRHFGFKAYPYTLVLLYRLMSYLME